MPDNQPNDQQPEQPPIKGLFDFLREQDEATIGKISELYGPQLAEIIRGQLDQTIWRLTQPRSLPEGDVVVIPYRIEAQGKIWKLDPIHHTAEENVSIGWTVKRIPSPEMEAELDRFFVEHPEFKGKSLYQIREMLNDQKRKLNQRGTGNFGPDDREYRGDDAVDLGIASDRERFTRESFLASRLEDLDSNGKPKSFWMQRIGPDEILLWIGGTIFFLVMLYLYMGTH